MNVVIQETSARNQRKIYYHCVNYQKTFKSLKLVPMIFFSHKGNPVIILISKQRYFNILFFMQAKHLVELQN